MNQAIVTKYLGPTNTKGARVKATCNGGAMTLNWDHEVDAEKNHRRVAAELAIEMEWLGKNRLIGGCLPNEAGYVFVLEEV